MSETRQCRSSAAGHPSREPNTALRIIPLIPLEGGYGGGTLRGFAMASLHFSYYGAGTIDDTPARQRIAIPLRNSKVDADQARAIVKGIGSHLKLDYNVDDLPPISDRLGELLRRAA
jgi:hypothetical protein